MSMLSSFINKHTTIVSQPEPVEDPEISQTFSFTRSTNLRNSSAAFKPGSSTPHRMRRFSIAVESISAQLRRRLKVR